MPAPYAWAGWEFDSLADVKQAIQEEAEAWLAKFKGAGRGIGGADLVYGPERGGRHAVKEVEIIVRLRDH